MMILSKFRLCMLGAIFAGLAASALAGAPVAPARPQVTAPAESRPAQADHPRRVEVPFPLDFRSPESDQRASAPRDSSLEDSGPHPFREGLLKRAALVEPRSATVEIRSRLSRLSDFS